MKRRAIKLSRRTVTEPMLKDRAYEIKRHAKDGLAAYVLKLARVLDVPLGSDYARPTFPEEFWP